MVAIMNNMRSMTIIGVRIGTNRLPSRRQEATHRKMIGMIIDGEILEGASK
jgi:hypothetical protein